ncbi:MAG: small ribosomal subunit Rsm22 family protein, partial [Candidatus Binatia bacterium]
MQGLYYFPEDLEQIISARARETGAEEPRRIAAAIARLSDLFNGKIPWDPAYHRDPRLRRAYLEYFLPVNLPKVRTPLSLWLHERPGVWAGRRLRCLDLGSGPGSALLGLCDFVRSLSAAERPSELDLVATDLSAENLDDAERLLRQFGEVEPALPPIRFGALRLDLFADRSGLFPIARAGGRFDLVIAANVLCELVREDGGLDRAEALIRSAALEVLEADGAIVLIEPGLRETSRDLHRLRDRLLRKGEGDPRPTLFVHAPCLHEDPCPALATERDWCTADMAWEPPRTVAELDRMTGLRKGSLKFSYLLLGAEPPPAPAPSVWRVVSDVLDLKGERRVYL